jgi:hypothetical protein
MLSLYTSVNFLQRAHIKTLFHVTLHVAVRRFTTDSPSAITCLGMRSVYVTWVTASRIRETVWLWRSNRRVRFLKFLRISGPYTHDHRQHHHQNHHTLSTSCPQLIGSVLFSVPKFLQRAPSLY